MNTTKVDKGHGGHFKVQNAAEFQNSPKVSKGGGPKAEAVVLRGARLARIFSKIWLTWRPGGVFQCNEILFAYVAEFEPSDHNHQADALNIETANSQSSKNKTWLLKFSSRVNSVVKLGKVRKIEDIGKYMSSSIEAVMF
ncbi:hypothetical protein EV1_045123 [Malus domestica]